MNTVCVISEQSPDLADVLRVVIETDKPIDETRLKDVSTLLPRGFARAQFQFLAKLPRNDMGKVDRLALARKG